MNSLFTYTCHALRERMMLWICTCNCCYDSQLFNPTFHALLCNFEHTVKMHMWGVCVTGSVFDVTDEEKVLPNWDESPILLCILSQISLGCWDWGLMNLIVIPNSFHSCPVDSVSWSAVRNLALSYLLKCLATGVSLLCLTSIRCWFTPVKNLLSVCPTYRHRYSLHSTQ